MDCQCGVLHHPIQLCTPGGIRVPHLCFVRLQVCVHLGRLLVSSEIHCCIDDATYLLGETKETVLQRKSEAQIYF